MTLMSVLRRKLNYKFLLLVFIFLIMLLAFIIGIRQALGNNVLGIDFFIFWMTGKATFIQHQNPYSNEIVQQIQIGRLNRLAFPGEDQLAFAYPLYMLFLIFPLSYLDFPIAQAVWLAVFILLLVTILYLLFSGKKLWPVFSALFFYPVVFSIILGNFDLLIFLIFLLFFWAHFSNRLNHRLWQITIGILLSFAIGKPQFSYLAFSFCLLIILKYKYWRVFAWFLGSLGLLLAASFITYPAWIPDWISRVQAYSVNNVVSPLYHSIISLFRQEQTQNFLTLIIFILLLVGLATSTIYWWRQSNNNHTARTISNSSFISTPKMELFILGLIGVVTFGFHPTSVSYEQLILYIPFFLWASYTITSHPWIVTILWWAGMALSWISFYLSRNANYPQALMTLPISFFVVWLLYLLFTIYPLFGKEKVHATP